MIDKEKIRLIKNSRPFRILDIVILLALIVCVVLILTLSYAKKGAAIRVTYNGTVTEYPLKHDRIIGLKDSEGEIILELEIKDGSCRVTKSTCPDGVCKQNVIKYNRQSIVCAPHGIVVEVTNKSKDNFYPIG